jgi:ubiquinone/menaquinone biosynthesis C-methylase UbiE
MNARQLEFPDDAFTHSFTCFAIFAIGQPEIAAGELYRALKPGGLAVVGSTNRVNWVDGVLWDIVVWLQGKDRDHYLDVFTDSDASHGPYRVTSSVSVEQRECRRRFSSAIDKQKSKGRRLVIQTAVVAAEK